MKEEPLLSTKDTFYPTKQTRPKLGMLKSDRIIY